MKRLTLYSILVLALTACSAPPTPAATDTPEVGMPNPASVHCQDMGNVLDIRTSADGSQHGVCVFPDGSECDEWAYFRGECSPANPAPEVTPTVGGDDPGSDLPPGATEAVVDWWGEIKKTDSGAQFDDYFERQDLGQTILFGIDSRDPAVEAQIVALRDSGKIVHLTGALFSDVPDVNGSQIVVVSLVVEE